MDEAVSDGGVILQPGRYISHRRLVVNGEHQVSARALSELGKALHEERDFLSGLGVLQRDGERENACHDWRRRCSTDDDLEAAKSGGERLLVRAEPKVKTDVRVECEARVKRCVTGNGLKHVSLLANGSDNLRLPWKRIARE